jgi:hypothetical protein
VLQQIFHIALTLSQKEDNSRVYIETMLDLHRRFQDLVDRCFGRDVTLTTALDKVCAAAIDCRMSAGRTRPSEGELAPPEALFLGFIRVCRVVWSFSALA